MLRYCHSGTACAELAATRFPTQGVRWELSYGDFDRSGKSSGHSARAQLHAYWGGLTIGQ